jgi:CheY-like chemotaxis protein
MSEKTTRDSILIIDDDSDLRAMIDAMAGIYGVRVLQAADCSTGIRILQREHRRIKLIFLDYFLPGMTLGQCATALLAKAGPIPVILLTAAYNPAARAAELHIDRWMAKPLDMAQLTQFLTATP